MNHDDVIDEMLKYFRVQFEKDPAWVTVMAWTLAALDATDRSGLTAEQKRDVQETLGILN